MFFKNILYKNILLNRTYFFDTYDKHIKTLMFFYKKKKKKHLHPLPGKKLVVQHAKGIKPHTAFKN